MLKHWALLEVLIKIEQSEARRVDGQDKVPEVRCNSYVRNGGHVAALEVVREDRG